VTHAEKITRQRSRHALIVFLGHHTFLIKTMKQKTNLNANIAEIITIPGFINAPIVSP
jgi:hypothetical protein